MSTELLIHHKLGFALEIFDDEENFQSGNVGMD